MMSSFFTDHLLPVESDRDSHSLLGALLALRHALPLLASYVDPLSSDNITQLGPISVNSGEKKVSEPEVKISVSHFIQLYEMLMYYVGHVDHNVVTASLEALHVLLKHAPPSFLHILVNPGTIQQTSIYAKDMAGWRDSAKGFYGFFLTFKALLLINATLYLSIHSL